MRIGIVTDVTSRSLRASDYLGEDTTALDLEIYRAESHSARWARVAEKLRARKARSLRLQEQHAE